MKKELLSHYLFLILFFFLITLTKGWYTSPVYLYFWLGGVVGNMLPDLDHLLYIFVSRPSELTSKRISSLISQKEWSSALDLLYKTRRERKMPVFHTIQFQILFAIVAFFVVTSTGSLFGTGLVLSAMLHLAVDQADDFFATSSISNWLVNLDLKLDRKQSSYYLFTYIISLLIISLLF